MVNHMEMEGMRGPWDIPGMGWRISASIMLGVGWFAFFILWLFFGAGGFDIYQNLAIIIVSIILVIGALAAMFASWGLKIAAKTEGGKEWKQQHGNRWFGWRGAVSTIIWIGWLAWLIIWLFFYAQDYNAYQNIAVFIVSLIIAGGVSGVIWGTMGRRMRW
jgi:hypothetical protein